MTGHRVSNLPSGRLRAVLRLGDLPPVQREALRAAGAYLAGKGARGYVVGGFVRDYLAGKISDDIDIAVGRADPAGLAGDLSRSLGLCRPVAYRRFKTVLVAGRGIKIEVCSLAGDLGADAARRDFTINCLYAELGRIRGAKGEAAIADPTSLGIADLEAGVLRTPADPVFTLWLDPLRVLRAVRFYACGGYRVPGDLARAMAGVAYLLTRVSPERIRVEIEQILVSPRVESAIRLMLETGALAVVIPEVALTDGFDQKTPYHAYDLFTHLVKTAAATPRDAALRLAALLHDVGKVSTQTANLNRMVYYGHEEASGETAAAVMRRLKFPKRSVDLVCFLVGNHMINYSAEWSDRAVRRFAARMGSNLGGVLALAEADRRAQKPGRTAGGALADLARRIRACQEVRGPANRLPIDGRDIMGILQVDQGPVVGKAKTFLLEESLKRRLPMSRGDAVAALKRWASARGFGTAEAGPAARSIGVDKPRIP